MAWPFGTTYNNQIDWSNIFKDGQTPIGLQGYNLDLSQNRYMDIMNNAYNDGFLNNNNWFGPNGYLASIYGGLQAGSAALNAWNGLNMYDLAKKQLRFATNTANANLNNSVENYYNAIKNANRIGYALQGSYARKAYGADNQELAATKAADEATKNLTRHV